MLNAPHSTSPGGRYAIHISAWEARMSHWIETPSISDTQGGTVLLRFADGNWSMESAQWQGDTVAMKLRKYPGDHTPTFFDVTIDCAAQSAMVRGSPVQNLAQVEAALERLYAAGRR